jgi:hypothetical protein
MNLTRKVILAIGLACPAVVVAAEIDGTAALTCTPSAGYDCTPAKSCRKIKQETKGVGVARIDFANKVVKTPYRADLLPIQNSSKNNEQLVMQGTDLKFAWSAIVNRQSGALTITVADREGAYLIFGQCKVADGG